MRSFFFIPANVKKYISSVNLIDATDIVFDLEDALGNSSVTTGLQNLVNISNAEKYWVRIGISNDEEHNLKVVIELLNIGFKRFILPKVEEVFQVDEFIILLESITNIKFEVLVLIESPLGVINADIICEHNDVSTIGFGSHDYCNIVGMTHSLENISWARQKILNSGRAYGKEIIDVTSMNVRDEKAFEEECINGKNMGFDGKFLIHPCQLGVFKKVWQFSYEEIAFAIKVKNEVDSIGGVENFTVLKIDGNVVEKPHLGRINKILKQTNNGGIKTW
ncbi:aldolase/citrate lyase family protein [Schleiferiaceae bacterium]|nr:aldolase/citrate lyase family protein [Schleiferiaceae bacterium]